MNKVAKFLLVTAAILVPLALIGGAVAATNSYEETEEKNNIPVVTSNVSREKTNEITVEYTIKKGNFVESYDEIVEEDKPYTLFVVNAIDLDAYNSQETTTTESKVKNIKEFIRQTVNVLSDDPSITRTTTDEKYDYVTVIDDVDTITEGNYETVKFSVTISDLKPETNYGFALEFYYVDIANKSVKGYNLNDIIYVKGKTKEGN